MCVLSTLSIYIFFGTSKLLQSDPNVLQKAMDELSQRYQKGGLPDLRKNSINSVIYSFDNYTIYIYKVFFSVK